VVGARADNKYDWHNESRGDSGGSTVQRINQGESEEFLFNDLLVMTECMISFSIVECGFGHDELSCYIYYFDEKG
jgi:hypothetical protein